MNKACPNCNGTYSGPIHWYEVRPNSREIVYRCNTAVTQEEVAVQAKRRFMKLWGQVRQQYLTSETCPTHLLAAYKDARASFMVAHGALNEQFSKYAG